MATIRAIFQGGETTITSTGSVNNAAYGDTRVLRCNNATGLTLTGIAAGVAGQLLVVCSVGAGTVTLNHQSGSSTAANQIVTLSGSDVVLAAGVGVVVLVYDATATRWREIAEQTGVAPTYTLDSLTDVDAGSPADGSVLAYNSGASQWKPVTGASGVFTTVDGKTVTVTGGVITDIS